MEFPPEIVAKILIEHDDDDDKIGKLISKNVSKSYKLQAYEKLVKDVSKRPILQEDIIGIEDDFISYKLQTSSNGLYMSYSSVVTKYEEEKEETNYVYRTFTKKFVIEGGKFVQKSNYEFDSHNSSGNGENIIYKDLYYVYKDECYTLTSLSITSWIYNFFLYDDAINLGFSDDILLKRMNEENTKKLVKEYYEKTTRRLKKYDKKLLLLFLITELDFEGGIIFDVDFDNDIDLQIKEAKSIIEESWYMKYGYFL